MVIRVYNPEHKDTHLITVDPTRTLAFIVHALTGQRFPYTG